MASPDLLLEPFELHVARNTSDKLLHVSRELSRISWALDGALRRYRHAEFNTQEEAEAMGEIFSAYQDAEEYLSAHWKP